MPPIFAPSKPTLSYVSTYIIITIIAIANWGSFMNAVLAPTRGTAGLELVGATPIQGAAKS
jgi:hypothetical protein